MGNELAIPYLEAAAIIGVITREDRQSVSRPVSSLFQRRGHGAEKIEVRIRQRYAGQVQHTSMDGEGVPVRTGNFKVREFSPSWMKVFATFGVREVAIFRKAGEAALQAEPGPEGIMWIEKANELIRELGVNLGSDLGTERERLCVGALKGTVTATMQSGETETINYNLSALTPPSTKWDNSGATIIANLYAAIDEFKANNPRGLPPTHVAYHPKLYKEAFVGNTEWKDFKKSSPDLAAGFLRLSGTRNEATPEGYFSDPLFGLTWFPIDGTYKDLSDASQSYWSYKDLTLFRPAEAGLEWGMTYGHVYNPRAEVNVEVELPTRKDVQVWKVHAMDNGLPVVKEPELIQTLRVIT